MKLETQNQCNLCGTFSKKDLKIFSCYCCEGVVRKKTWTHLEIYELSQQTGFSEYDIAKALKLNWENIN